MDRSHLRNRPALFAPVQKIWVRNCDLTDTRIGFTDHDDARGIAIRQRPQQHRIHDAKDRRRRANSERQRQHCSNREAGLLAQHPERESQVLPHRFHKGHAVHMKYLLADLRRIPQFSVCRIARFIRQHPARNIFVRFNLHVRLQLSRPLLIPPSS